MTLSPPAGIARRHDPESDDALASVARVVARLMDVPFAAVIDVTAARPLVEWGAEAGEQLQSLVALLHNDEAGEPVVATSPWPTATLPATAALQSVAIATVSPHVSLAVGDVRPRAWSNDDLAAFAHLARAAGALLDRARADPHGSATRPAGGSWTWDLATGAVTWSAATTRVLGLPRGEVAVGAHPFFDLAHPEDREEVQHAVRRAVTDRRDFLVVYRIVRPDGTTRRIRLRGRVVDTTTLEPSLVVGTCDDVTDGIESEPPEEAADRRSALLAAAIETMREVARSELDADAMTERIARRAMELTGADGALFGSLEGDYVVFRSSVGFYERTPPPVHIGNSLAGYCLESGDVVRCDDADLDPRVDRAAAAAFDVRSMVQVPLVYRGDTIGVLSVSSRRRAAFTDDDGHLLQLLAGVTAALISHASAYATKSALVAERTAALDALRDAHEMLSTLVRASPLAITTLSPDFVVTSWNPAAETMFGWSASEVVGRPLPGIGADESDDSRQRRHALASGAQRTQSYEERRLRRDGSVVDVAVAAASLADAQGRPRGMVYIFSDVTERRRLEARLRQAQRMEAVGQLAGGVAHDFNNLLTIMQLHAEALLAELPADDPLRDDAAEIQRQSERAASLTRQLLAFSRKQLLQPRALDLNATVREVEKMLRRVIGERISLAVSLADTLSTVMADPNQVVQVLLNLAVNARDAMPDGGTLTLRTADVWLDAAYGDAHGAVVPAGWYAMLEVSDTGMGMDRPTQQRVFEPFFTTKEPGKGTGLGLATVYGIVKQSGGYIWVYSESGLGATFKVYLPRLGSPSTSAIDDDELDQDRGGNETVLLVEDDGELRELAREHLTQLGYSVLVASSGESALRLGAEHQGRLHLLVTDIVMPGMSGAQVAEQLRTMRPEVRVLFVSGYSDDDAVRRGLLAPRQAMLQKPFSRRALAVAVRRTLDA